MYFKQEEINTDHGLHGQVCIIWINGKCWQGSLLLKDPSDLSTRKALMPQLHPRHHDVARATTALQLGLLDIEERYSLTEIEMLDILISQLHTLTREMLREERKDKDDGDDT